MEEHRPRVLVMDDSEIALTVVRETLHRGGFDVRAAQSLGEFNVILKTWSPTIVLTDVNMPGISGPELCRWIKVRVDTGSVPVILFSDLSEKELETIATDVGADGFISKESGMEKLTTHLKALCEEMVW